MTKRLLKWLTSQEQEPAEPTKKVLEGARRVTLKVSGAHISQLLLFHATFGSYVEDTSSGLRDWADRLELKKRHGAPLQGSEGHCRQNPWSSFHFPLQPGLLCQDGRVHTHAGSCSNNSGHQCQSAILWVPDKAFHSRDGRTKTQRQTGTGAFIN